MKYPLSTKTSDLSHKLKISPVQEGCATVCLWFKTILSRKANKNERGQGLVEFALVIPILLLLMIGIIEFGYYLFVYSSVNTAAREAARYAAGSGTNSGGDVYSRDCDGIREVARRIGQYAEISDANIDISYDNGPDSSPTASCIGDYGTYQPVLGDRVVVTVTGHYQPLIMTKAGQFWDSLDNVSITAKSARTIIRRMQVGD